MTDFTYKAYLPDNAEVIVDYTKPPKERTSFNYVFKRSWKESLLHGGFRTFSDVWWYVTLPVYWFVLGFGIARLMAFNIDGLYTIVSAWLMCNGVPWLALLFASLNKERLADMIPKMNYKLSLFTKSLKQKVVTTSDLVENKYIIPLFHNIYLDWESTGDFGRYLKKVEVLSIPNDFEWKDRKTKKPRPNEYLFRAVFYFKQRPREGQMNLVFD